MTQFVHHLVTVTPKRDCLTNIVGVTVVVKVTKEKRGRHKTFENTFQCRSDNLTFSLNCNSIPYSYVWFYPQIRLSLIKAVNIIQFQESKWHLLTIMTNLLFGLSLTNVFDSHLFISSYFESSSKIYSEYCLADFI